MDESGSFAICIQSNKVKKEFHNIFEHVSFEADDDVDEESLKETLLPAVPKNKYTVFEFDEEGNFDSAKGYDDLESLWDDYQWGLD